MPRKIWATVNANKVLTFEQLHRAKDEGQIPVEITQHYLEFEGLEISAGANYSTSLLEDEADPVIRLTVLLLALKRHCNPPFTQYPHWALT